MHEEFLPKTLDDMMIHVQEECAELIVAISKAKRFGLYSKNPYIQDSKSNIQSIYDESMDTLNSIERMLEVITYKYIGT